MIYVTHDQVEAMTMGGRICIMHEGKVAQIGAPLEVYRRPANLFVAALPRQPADEPPAGAARRRRTALVRRGGAASALDGAVDRPARRRRDRRRAALRRSARRPGVARRAPERGRRAIVQAVEPLGAETIVSRRSTAVGRRCRARAAATVVAQPGERDRSRGPTCRRFTCSIPTPARPLGPPPVA